MAYGSSGLSGPIQFGDNKKLYYYNTTADTIAQMVAAGYFNNADDDLGFDNEDIFVLKDSASRLDLAEVTNSTGGDVTLLPLSALDGFAETTTGGALSPYGISFLNSTQAFTLHTAPVRAGQRKKIVAISAGPSVTTTGGAPLIGQASTGVLVFDDAYSAVELTAFSSTNWVITACPLHDTSSTGEAKVRTS